jgi:hypothetical protein
MYRSTLSRRTLALLCLFALLGGTAQASMVAFSVSGSVTDADPGNAFALSAGNAVSLSGIFDDSALAASGDSEVFFGSGSGNRLTLTIGAIAYNETMDLLFGPGTGPSLAFLDGDLMGISFLANLGTNGAVATLFAAGGGWNGADSGGHLVSGTFALEGFDTAPVPAPAPALLLAPWLLGRLCRVRRPVG